MLPFSQTFCRTRTPGLGAPLLEDFSNILPSSKPGLVFPTSLSVDTQQEYLKLLLLDNTIKEIVERTIASSRFLRYRAKQHIAATFKDTSEEIVA